MQATGEKINGKGTKPPRNNNKKAPVTNAPTGESGKLITLILI